MTDLDRIILNFLNENKLYPTNMVNTLTKKLGDSSDETLNKIAIFGLFREQPPFKTIKDINKLNSLDELTKLFNEWKDYAVKGLMDAPGELKGNKTATLAFVDAYINNIRSLKDNAKPFSFKGYEQSLIDVVNNNSWIRQDNIAAQTHGIEKPHDSDIMFEDDNILILKGSTKAKCISYGQGYSWCISQTQLNYYNHYRITNGATIYFVLNKKLPKDDVERVCVILRYSGDKYGIADKTNTGKRSGGPEVAGDGFGYVESQLPWLRGMEKYFPESEVTQSEKDYEAAVSVRYTDNDLGSYIINKSKELNFNGEEIDPVDFLKDYLHRKNISDEQFVSLTEPMKVQVIEMGKELSNEIITNLSGVLKVRYAVIRLSNKYDINLGLYSDEERGRILNNLKDKLNTYIISNLIGYTPEKQRYNLALQILSLVKDKLDKDIVSIMLYGIPEKQRYELVLEILPLVKDKLDKDIVNRLLIVPKEQRYELVKQIFPLVKDKLDNDIVGILLKHTQSGQSYELIQQMFPFIKDKLDYEMESEIRRNANSDDIPKIEKLLGFKSIDIEDLDNFMKTFKNENKYQQKDTINELRLLVRKILKENIELSNYVFDDMHMDNHHGQDDYKVVMKDKEGNKLAYADYTDYKGEITINFIESIVKGKGYGSMIMDYLANKYGYEKLERTNLTPDGVKMRIKLDKKYNFNYDDYKNSLSKHLNKSVIDNILKKQPIIGKFLQDIIKYGNSKTFEHWIDYLQKTNLINKYDFNDIAEIGEWVSGSVTNDNPINDSPPEFITDLISNLSK
jgi:hypothetical protein